MSVWMSLQPVTSSVLTLWEHMTALVRKATELEVVGKLASVSHCEEFYFLSSNYFDFHFVLQEQERPRISSLYLSSPFSLHRLRSFFSFCSPYCNFNFCACCSSPTFTIGLLKWPSQRLVPFSCPLLGCLVQTLSFLSWTLAQFYFLLPTCWSQAFCCVVLASDDDDLEEEEELEVVRFPGLLFRGLPLLLHYVATSLPPTYEREDREKRK